MTNPPQQGDSSRIVHLSLTEGEVIEQIARRAGREATLATEARLATMLRPVFLFVTVVGGLVVFAGVAAIEHAVRVQLDQRLENELAERLSRLSALPLLATEIQSLMTNRSYSVRDADAIVDVLRQLAPEIAGLSWDTRRLAYGNVADAIRAFTGAGDLTRAIEVVRMFPADFLQHEAVIEAVGLTVALGTIHHPDFPDQIADVYQGLIAQIPDPDGMGIEYQKLAMILVRASSAGWMTVDLTTAIEQRAQASNGFPGFVGRVVETLDTHFRTNGNLRSPLALERLTLLRDAARTAPAPKSD
jgi:hypothetical protein